jgi:hypothetical protein
MNRILVTLISLVIISSTGAALAEPGEDVDAAMQAWLDGMNNHNAERVVALDHRPPLIRCPCPVS